MRVSFTIRRRWLVVGGIIAVLVAASVGIAAWIVTSTGNAGGKTGTLAAPTVISAAPSTPDLWPGDGPGSIAIQTTNTSSHPLKLTGIQQIAGANVVSGDTANCPNSNFSWVGDVVFATPIDVPVGGPTKIDIPASAFPAGTGLTMAANAPTTCQGLNVSLTGFRFTFSS